MKPHPVPKDLYCSECGLDWDDHPENPRRRDCIELLKARKMNVYPVTQPYVPYVRPWWGETWNTWTTSNVGGTSVTKTLPVKESTTDTIVIYN